MIPHFGEYLTFKYNLVASLESLKDLAIVKVREAPGTKTVEYIQVYDSALSPRFILLDMVVTVLSNPTIPSISRKRTVVIFGEDPECKQGTTFSYVLDELLFSLVTILERPPVLHCPKELSSADELLKITVASYLVDAQSHFSLMAKLTNTGSVLRHSRNQLCISSWLSSSSSTWYGTEVTVNVLGRDEGRRGESWVRSARITSPPTEPPTNIESLLGSYSANYTIVAAGQNDLRGKVVFPRHCASVLHSHDFRKALCGYTMRLAGRSTDAESKIALTIIAGINLRGRSRRERGVVIDTSLGPMSMRLLGTVQSIFLSESSCHTKVHREGWFTTSAIFRTKNFPIPSSPSFTPAIRPSLALPTLQLRMTRADFHLTLTNVPSLVLPDFSGNRIITLCRERQGHSSCVSHLYLVHDGGYPLRNCPARNHIGPGAQKIIFLQERLTTIYVAGYIFMRDALRSITLPELDYRYLHVGLLLRPG
ncbi:uncharacterized protein BT62DRAFT_1079746 [Guyanagaster necrorhizus]|uniref:Uncharacterized protein n=1 Tax=Guyanagaster necrorhizus TaxID=856835 RepID=A0A9P8ANI6_9AGAR|nr:uncharacterized protein BT62DRAFT_1079746 [Guyanagaster necrorhizus MCA 3950]KAG7441786.1 hypothetical protein BT62DRAFT_1079746 [Guyanagaster necrorhizus MCA 3950]